MNLKEHLANGILTISFTKKNGDIREMQCTLQEAYLPKVVGQSIQQEGLTTVFDVEKGAWRSFRNDSIISVTSEGKALEGY